MPTTCDAFKQYDAEAEARYGGKSAYDEIVAMYKSHPQYEEMGIFAGYGEYGFSDGDDRI